MDERDDLKISLVPGAIDVLSPKSNPSPFGKKGIHQDMRILKVEAFCMCLKI
jgi:hypothetical protein